MDITNPVHAKGVVHEQIADTAKGLCRSYWEETATKSNEFYAAHKDPDFFVAQCWSEFVPIARSVLVDMLSRDFMPSGERIPQTFKDQIYDALKLDGGVNPRKVSKSNLLTDSSSLILPPKGAPSVH